MGEQQRLAGAEQLARAYYKLLSSIDWDDPLLVGGLREGLNKFLSNAHLASLRGRNKYHKTHLVSPLALKLLQSGQPRPLVWEHLVPKGLYIQGPCEQQARAHTLTLDFVFEHLRKFWHLATITVDETRMRMPPEWDGANVLARYEAQGLTLIPNPFFDALTNEGAASQPRPRRRT